jgi:hypothetical protein
MVVVFVVMVNVVCGTGHCGAGGARCCGICNGGDGCRRNGSGV